MDAIRAFHRKYGIVAKSSSSKSSSKNATPSTSNTSSNVDLCRRNNVYNNHFSGPAARKNQRSDSLESVNSTSSNENLSQSGSNSNVVYSNVNPYYQEQNQLLMKVQQSQNDRNRKNCHFDEELADELVFQYARSCKRFKERRQTAAVQDFDEEADILELSMLLDKTRGLPCKTKRGKASQVNLFELNYRDRKRECLLQKSVGGLSPDQAYDMLMCKYLRLTPSNIDALETMAMYGGYDISLHPHMSEEQLDDMQL